jgi:hypothetical protein
LSDIVIWIHAYQWAIQCKRCRRCKFVLSKLTSGNLTGFWSFFSPAVVHCPNLLHYLLKILYQASQKACQWIQPEI